MNRRDLFARMGSMGAALTLGASATCAAENGHAASAEVSHKGGPLGNAHVHAVVDAKGSGVGLANNSFHWEKTGHASPTPDPLGPIRQRTIERLSSVGQRSAGLA